MNDLTDFLFARPSLLEGFARAYDIGGTLQEYNVSPNGEAADALALEMDMRAIANDFNRAIAAVAAEIENASVEKR